MTTGSSNTNQSPVGTPKREGGLKAKAAQQRNKKKQAIYRRHFSHSAQNSPSGSPARPGKNNSEALGPTPPADDNVDATAAAAEQKDTTVDKEQKKDQGKPRPTPLSTSSPTISPATSPGPSPSASPSRAGLQKRRRKAELLSKRVALRNKVMPGSKTPPRDNPTKSGGDVAEDDAKHGDDVMSDNATPNARSVDQSKNADKSDHDEYIKDLDKGEVETKSDVSSGFDMRSIHDHPPSPPSEPELKEEANVDPSWDANKVQFDGKTDEVVSNVAAKDSLNMFETDSWAVTDLDFEALPNHPDIEAVAARLMEEEAKAKFLTKVDEEKAMTSNEKVSVDEVAAPKQGSGDPSWDVANPLFQQKLAEAKALGQKDGLDMFDTASWGNTEAAFSDVSLSRMLHADIEAEFVRLVQEDMAKRPQEGDGQQNQTDFEHPIIFEEKKSGDANEESKFPPPKDDLPLLAGVGSSSEDDPIGTNELVAGYGTDERILSMEERVKLYTEPQKPDDYSSALEEEEGPDFEYDCEEDEPVDYISQASDEDDDEETLGAGVVPDATILAGDVPTFDPTALVPTQLSENSSEDMKGTRPKVELENMDMVDDDSSDALDTRGTESSVLMEGSANSSLMGERFLGAGSVGGSSVATGGSVTQKRPVGMGGVPPLRATPAVPLHPPPPPPSSEKKKRKSKKRSGKKTDVPLLPPPPEEKLKKWEEGKMRGQKHLESLKAGCSKDLSTSSSPVDTARALVIQNALGRATAKDSGNNGEQDGEVHGPPELMRKAYQNEFGTQDGSVGLFLERNPESPKLFGGASKVKSPKASVETTPTAGSTILVDKKLADKVARASSAAANTFEQQFAHVDEGILATPKIRNREEVQNSSPNVFVCAQDNMENMRENFLTTVAISEGAANMVVSESFIGSPSSRAGCNDKAHETGMELVGGAFSPWKNPDFSSDNILHSVKSVSGHEAVQEEEDEDVVAWFYRDVLGADPANVPSPEEKITATQSLLEDDANFNVMCQYMADCVNTASTEICQAASFEELEDLPTQESLKSLDSMDSYVKKRPLLKPMVLTKEGKQLKPNLLAANFVSFLALASKLANVPSPFGDENPFLLDLVEISLRRAENGDETNITSNEGATVQQLVFGHTNGKVDVIVDFVHKVCKASEAQIALRRSAGYDRTLPDSKSENIADARGAQPESSRKEGACKRTQVFPEDHPSPFEAAVTSKPRIVVVALSFLGDPVAVCRMKMVNQSCRQIISENEHMIMRDAVRAGGLSMNVRPAFWMWITLQKCGRPDVGETEAQDQEEEEYGSCNRDLLRLEQQGREGKWHNVIQRDVARSFGNMPPHKTGARLRTDSIVRALVTWGKNRIMKRGVKGGGHAMPTPAIDPHDAQRQKDRPQLSQSPPPWEVAGDNDSQRSDLSRTPTDTVSEWGGVSPVGSFSGSMSGAIDGDGESRVLPRKKRSRGDATPAEELALSGNALTEDMKVDLQNKLGFILHALAAAHEDVGYCQGMDYVVAHLLRILQDTIRWKYLRGTLPASIKASRPLHIQDASSEEDPRKFSEEIDQRLLVEETVFSVMDTFFTTYNLRHMYWPELRYLKICCRVFERLIQIKLPVLADHFQHHELNVGLFALGWFQTLFLYLPSMPSATVCHMWDIWLVERSFKIFFRVGTAILFLSQPILLNHELEGMMTYLNTIPDATLLNPDILIACALNIKVTNSMLAELEAEVTGGTV